MHNTEHVDHKQMAQRLKTQGCLHCHCKIINCWSQKLTDKIDNSTHQQLNFLLGVSKCLKDVVHLLDSGYGFLFCNGERNVACFRSFHMSYHAMQFCHIYHLYCAKTFERKVKSDKVVLVEKSRKEQLVIIKKDTTFDVSACPTQQLNELIPL